MPEGASPVERRFTVTATRGLFPGEILRASGKVEKVEQVSIRISAPRNRAP
jgi:hypothetical protein